MRVPNLGRFGSRVALAFLVLVVTGCSSRMPIERAPLAFRQAEDSFKLGHYDRAAHGYRIFIDSNETGELVPRAYFKLARSEFRLGRFDECVATLDELERRYPDDEWRQVYELRGNAEAARGNPVSAVHYWERALDGADRSRRALLRQQISDAVRKMDPQAVARTRTVVTKDETRRLIDTISGSPDPVSEMPDRKKASPTPERGQGVGPTPVTAGKVAVLLPLSGTYEAYGRRSLVGINLALAESGIEVVVRDTAGEAQLARAAIDDLAATPDVMAVIGPLRSKEAQGVIPRAERAGLPLISLAQNKSPSGRYVLQTAMTHELQASRLAEFAIGTAGLRKFGILFPRDAYGMALSEAFRDEVNNRGGHVVGSIAYEPGATEFSVEVLTLQRWVDADGLQAVFIPDFAKPAGLLSRALRAARPQIALLGSNGWHDPGQLGVDADALDGAVFVDGFFIGSQRAATQRFLEAYRAVHSDAPGVLEAQAYDAASVVRRAFESGASRSRDELISSMRGMGRFDGAAGAMTFGEGDVERELFLLQLEGRRIREITGDKSGGRVVPTSVPPPPSALP